MNTTTFSLEQLNDSQKPAKAKKAMAAPATPKKRKLSTVEKLHVLRKFKWDFEAMKRA